jgi:hypothetical protein
MDLSIRAEHFRKMATRYQELAELARPAGLSDFYRSYAVRYGVMAREASERAERHPYRTAVGDHEIAPPSPRN